MTEMAGSQGPAWGWRVAWGPGDGRLVPGCPTLLLEVLPGYEWVLRSSKVRMGVNPKGILVGVALRPTGRAWLQRQAAVRAGSASGIPGSGKPAGRLVEEFSQPEPSRPPSLWFSYCSTGKWGWRRAPTPPGSLSPGEQEEKLKGG